MLIKGVLADVCFSFLRILKFTNNFKWLAVNGLVKIRHICLKVGTGIAL
jgi:hypothetical protein